MAAGGADRGAEIQSFWAADSTKPFFHWGTAGRDPVTWGVSGARPAGEVAHNSLQFAGFLALPEGKEFCYLFLILK